MLPVIPFRRRSRYPRVPFALGALAAIALGAAVIAAWMIWQRSSVSPSGQIIEVIDGDTVRLNGAVYRLVGFDTPERVPFPSTCARMLAAMLGRWRTDRPR